MHPSLICNLSLLCLLAPIRLVRFNLFDNLHPNCTCSCSFTSLTEGRSARTGPKQLGAKKESLARKATDIIDFYLTLVEAAWRVLVKLCGREEAVHSGLCGGNTFHIVCYFTP